MVEVVDVDAALAVELGGFWVREGAELGINQRCTDGEKIIIITKARSAGGSKSLVTTVLVVILIWLKM